MDRPPLSSKYMIEIAEAILEPIRRGESACIRWFPGHGKTIRLHQIFSDKKLLQHVLGKYFDRFVVVEVNSAIYTLPDLPTFFLNVYASLQEEFKLRTARGQSYQPHPLARTPVTVALVIAQIIRLARLTVEEGLEVVFIIDSIDEFPTDVLAGMLAGWASIAEANRERIHTHINVNRREIIEHATEPVLLQNIVHIGLPPKKECDYYISFYVREWGLKISKIQIAHIYKVCGHDLGLIKEALRMYKKNGTQVDLRMESTIALKAKAEFKLFSSQEQQAIEARVNTNAAPPALTQTVRGLTNANFWDASQKLPEIFEHVILHRDKLQTLSFDTTHSILTLGDINLKKKFSSSEHNVLVALYKQKGTVVSRDEVAQSLWGEQMLDRYSDWAIDKVISRLRSRIVSLHIPCQIMTMKKKGFYLEF